MIDGRIALSEPTRQSVWAPIFIAGRLLRRIGLANLGVAVIALLSGRISSLLLAAAVVGAVGLAAVSLLAWWRRVFFVADEELILMQGIVNLQRVTIPLGRIQSVNLDQQLLHRPFGLVRARIETAGSAGAEFELEALDGSTAGALRSLVATEHAVDSDGTTAEAEVRTVSRQVLRRSPADLVKVALSRNAITDIALVLPFIFVVSEFADALGISEEELFRSQASWFRTVAGLVGAYVVVLAVIWFGTTFLRYYNLTLFHEGERLRSTAGLLNTTERSSSLNRIQLLRVRQNLIHRRFGIRHVSLPTASGTVGRSDTMTLPGTTESELADIRSLTIPELGPRPARPISSKAIGRWVQWIGLLPAAIAAAAILVLSRVIEINPVWGALVIVWVGLVAVLAPVIHRRWSWRLTRDLLETKHGLIATKIAVIPLYKAQAVSVRRTWFHRRRDLASIIVHSAGGDVYVPHIPRSVAARLRDHVLWRAETDQRPWM